MALIVRSGRAVGLHNHRRDLARILDSRPSDTTLHIGLAVVVAGIVLLLLAASDLVLVVSVLV